MDNVLTIQHEDLVSDPQNPHKPGAAAYLKPQRGGQTQVDRGFLVPQLSRSRSSWFSETPCTKNKVESNRGKASMLTSDPHMHRHNMCMRNYTIHTGVQKYLVSHESAFPMPNESLLKWFPHFHLHLRGSISPQEP